MNNPAPPIPSNPPRRGRVRVLLRAGLRWIEHGLALFGALILLFWTTLDVSPIISPSMSPTLKGENFKEGDRVLTEKLSYRFRRPRRWEVVTFVASSGEKRMKRVAGLPGENVQSPANGQLMIDGQQVELPSSMNGKFLRYGHLLDGVPVPCGEGYYVLGDDLIDSFDSRFEGPIPSDQVVGRAWLIVWPYSRFGWVR